MPRRGEWQANHINALVDGRPITANSMRQNDVTFTSTSHVIVTGNQMPRADAVEGIWSRLVPIMFEHRPSEDRPDLMAELLEDGGGVLEWAMEGLRRTIRAGAVQIPDVLRRESERVRTDADPVALFVQECIEQDAEASVTAAALRTSLYDAWWEHNGEGRPPSDRSVMKRLTALGLPPSTSIRAGTTRGRVGVRLKAEAS